MRRSQYKDTRQDLKSKKNTVLFRHSEKNVIDFLGLNEQAKKFGLGSFDLKFYRLAKISGKTENYSISTQQQLDLELPLLLDSDTQMVKAS